MAVKVIQKNSPVQFENIDLSDTDLKSILNKAVKDSGDSKLRLIERAKDCQRAM
jgi:hypothetical protein